MPLALTRTLARRYRRTAGHPFMFYIHPREITDELKNLLDRLPAVPFEQVEEQLVAELGRPVEIAPEPQLTGALGAALLAVGNQGTHPPSD